MVAPLGGLVQGVLQEQEDVGVERAELFSEGGTLHHDGENQPRQEL